MGFNDVLRKPITPETLYQKLERWLVVAHDRTGSAPQADGPTGVSAESIAAIAQLCKLLENGDSEANDFFREHVPLLRPVLGPRHQVVKHALEAFEFEQALDLLQPFLKAGRPG